MVVLIAREWERKNLRKREKKMATNKDSNVITKGKGAHSAVIQSEELGNIQMQENNIHVAGSEEEERLIMQQVHHQMRVIKQGAVNLVGEEELEKKIANSILTHMPLTIKFGMDPSAPDIHLGHAVVLRKLKQLQDLGHNIVIIIGDFTAKIGDPTGKSKGRKAMTDGEVLVNALTYQEQIFHILDREKTQVRYNGEWLEMLRLDEVLKLASTITVARMLERDDFENRFKNNIPIGLHEFFYPLMQAYDSVELHADLELGGTDQTFNILMGRSLQKDMGMDAQAALFMPILEGIDGVEKMSKSLGNYIGIHEDAKTMFQKVMQIPDGLIIKYFELATDILPEELDVVKNRLKSGENPKEIKLLLARTITSLYHDEEETQAGEKFFEEAFTKKEIPEEIDNLEIKAQQNNLFDCLGLFVEKGLIKSGSELRRLIAQGGVRKNGEVVKGMEEIIASGDVLRIGKKKFVKLILH